MSCCCLLTSAETPSSWRWFFAGHPHVNGLLSENHLYSALNTHKQSNPIRYIPHTWIGPLQHEQETANPMALLQSTCQGEALLSLFGNCHSKSPTTSQSRGFPQHDLKYMPSSKEFLIFNPSKQREWALTMLTYRCHKPVRIMTQRQVCKQDFETGCYSLSILPRRPTLLSRKACPFESLWGTNWKVEATFRCISPVQDPIAAHSRSSQGSQMPTQKLSPHDPIPLLDDMRRSTSERVCENQPSSVTSSRLVSSLLPTASSHSRNATTTVTAARSDSETKDPLVPQCTPGESSTAATATLSISVQLAVLPIFELSRSPAASRLPTYFALLSLFKRADSQLSLT